MNSCVKTVLSIILALNFNTIFANDTLPYDYKSTTYIPIKLAIKKEISTKNALTYGMPLEFIVQEDVIYNNKIVVKSGELVIAKLGTVVTSGMNGFPAEITIDDFDIPNINDSKLLCTYTKYGINRSLWVYPLKWALTPIPLAGSFTNFIKGGHAKIKPTETIIIKYFPDWQ